MAKVSLRIYNREIEGFIDQGATNEAIAHCHHILKTFSKHLATYRLLGKAYLESKRYPEAVDVFGRVLMSVPDDFVAHVGMSIIHDEENKLDNAIWHMQRAFESQPSNSAIQGELQRLYGRRDGMEPPKIRMTRGALAQMYVQGELYPQAIAEIRAVLAQEPDRADMQVLLARAYFRGGQKADASDMCAQLLKRYLYCFDANRIMVDLLPATAGAVESTQVYRMRVGELDPYATFVKGSVFQSDEVADAAINLERLEYKEEEPQPGQEWSASLGAGATSAPMLASASRSDQPDWLKTGGFSDASPQSEPVVDSPADSQSGANIPEFLRDAGWGESNNPEQPTSFFESEPAGGDLTPAEIPDWLKGQVPSNSTQSANVPSQSIDTPDWLSGLGDSQSSESMLAQNDKDLSAASEPAQSVGDVPDWLAGLGDSQTSEPVQKSDVPDWLNGLAGDQSEPAIPGDIPEWLGGADSQDAPVQPEQADAVAWLDSLATKYSVKPEEMVTHAQDMNQQAQASQIPEPTSESLGSTAQEQDDAVAWLESLAAKHGAKPEELVTDPSKRSETPPDWVSQAQNIGQQAVAPSVESLGSTAQEQDDAVAWLESLAVKHGAKPEELVTDPNKRFDTPPEWVTQAQSIGETQTASASLNTEKEESNQAVENALNIGEQFFAEFENASTAEPAAPLATDETGMWLRGLEQKDKQDEFSTQPAGETKDAPDWLISLQNEPEQLDEQNTLRSTLPEWISDSQQPQADPVEQEPIVQKSDLPNWLSGVDENSVTENTFADQEVSQNDLSNWLSSLDNEPGLPFDEMPTPDSILIKSTPAAATKEPGRQESVAPKSDLPDWLSGVDSPGKESDDEWKKSIGQEPVVLASSQIEESAPVNLTENLPDWLQSMDEEEASQDNVPAPRPNRKAFEEQEAQQPKPTAPSDWHPVEPKQPMSISMEKQEIPLTEPRKSFTPLDVPPAEPFEPAQQSAAKRTVEAHVPAKKKSGLPVKQRQPEAQSIIAALNQAKGELDRGDIPTALDHYKKLIKKGKHLEETIRDLTDSIYRYPVEVGIWQTLGDAYMRANRLKEALESYNKAEELIR